MPEIMGLILMWIKKKRGGIPVWVVLLMGFLTVGTVYLQTRPRPIEIDVGEPRGVDLPAAIPTPAYTLPVVVPESMKEERPKEAPEAKVWMSVKEMPVSHSYDQNREEMHNYSIFHRLFREAMIRKDYDETSTLALLARLKEYAKEGKTTREDIFEAIEIEFPNVSEFDKTRIFYTFSASLSGIADAIREENKERQ